MADIHQLPDIEEVEREASEWIARLHADDTSSEDRARFDAWRKAHPSHVRAYEEMSATWRQFMEAGPIVRAVAFGQALGATQLGAVQKTRPARWQWASAIAATVTIAVLCGWLWVAQPTPQTLFQTAIGEQASVELPDGSMLELNSNSRARIDYTEGARVIRLERGEAFFNVHHDALRPFWVVAGDSWVRAVGTAFNVQILSAGVRVTVSEGAIKVASAPAPRGEVPSDQRLAQVAVSALTAGQQVNVNGEASEVRSLPEA
jgi:transmembrane sensor